MPQPLPTPRTVNAMEARRAHALVVDVAKALEDVTRDDASTQRRVPSFSLSDDEDAVDENHPCSPRLCDLRRDLLRQRLS